MIRRETKVGELVTANPAAAHVFEEAGVDYCCGGSQSLHQACLDAGVPEEEILERLRQSKLASVPGDVNWLAAALSDLTRHIREKHHHYVREAIQRISPQAAKVKAEHGNKHPELGQIEGLFARLGREMTMHMQKEEQILFPYIEAVERAVNTHGSVEPPFFQTVRNPIHVMMKEHDATGDLIRHIRSLTSDYTAPADACTSFRALYESLREFEADLHQHVHLENNILFSRAVEMEATAA